MAAEWGLGMGMGMGMTAVPSAAVAPPNSSTYLYGLPSTDTLRIDDLLDFSNHNVFSSSTGSTAPGAAYNYNHLPQPVHNSSLFTITTGEGGNIDSGSHHLCSFPDDLYAPSDEAAELEWLSKFVEDSFSDVPYPLSTMITTNNHSSGNKSNSNNYHLIVNNNQIQVDPTSAAPRQGARSKRSIASSFIANMTSTLRHHQRNSSSSSSTSSSSSSDFPNTNNTNTTPTSSGSSRRKGHMNDGTNIGVGVEGGVRRCTHCASEKTPQWRTGPLGPKTLCNACGVRYKSGRLVPEYRPAASPTFVLTQHSNSHRKVMELRRQKEQVHLIRHDNVSSASTATEMIYHDYEQ